jgi:hypothetical protein
MNPQENITNNQENDALSNISISDLEAQIIGNLVSQNEEAKTEALRGILRRETPEAIELDLQDSVLKACSILFIVIICTPIIISDLYFGFTDTSCVNDMPAGLEISMKLYLLVSGFVSLTAMVVYIKCISLFSSLDENNANLFCVYFTSLIVQTFHIIWTILGAIVFWGTIYGEKKCDKNVSTYIFVSLIIKFVGNLVGIMKSNSEKKK